MKPSGFERSLLESGELMKRGCQSVIQNMGKAIAAITAVLACLVTFTEIGFCDPSVETFTPTLLLMLIGSYVIYFSMEDAGERLGEESEEYRKAMTRYTTVREKIDGNHMDRLRDFCKKYAAEEAEFRRSSLLLAAGVSAADMKEPAKDRATRKKRQHLLRKLRHIRPLPLSPALLLTKKTKRAKSELENPESTKFFRLLLGMLPTTVCMTVTVSVFLTAKSDLGAAEIINGLLRLSSLPVIAFRGYARGYGYVRSSVSLWLETKAKLLEAFLTTLT